MNYIKIILDTTAPATPSISINDGAIYANDLLVDCRISTADSNTNGYQMKIWGDVSESNNANIQSSEVESNWISFNPSQQVRLSEGDGQKTLFLKLRDEVNNESSIASASITYDGSKPVVTVTDPDVNKISTVEGKNIVNFSFTANEPFVEYMVKAVSSTGATEDTGTIIPTTNGSVNTSGTGDFNTTTSPITVSITGQDLQTASSGDGEKIIKVFVRDASGLWST